LLVLLGGVVAVLVAGSVAGVVVALRYAHATPLANHGGEFGWARPDNRHTRFAGPPSDAHLVAPARLGQPQSFYVDITNDAPVTQTILGLTGLDAASLLHERLAAAVDDDPRVSSFDRTYRSMPVSIPPHATRTVRLTVVIPRCRVSGPQSWDRLHLRVRVGWFTRTETVLLSDVYVLDAPIRPCAPTR
jgi:hypothetical protein